MPAAEPSQPKEFKGLVLSEKGFSTVVLLKLIGVNGLNILNTSCILYSRISSGFMPTSGTKATEFKKSRTFLLVNSSMLLSSIFSRLVPAWGCVGCWSLSQLISGEGGVLQRQVTSLSQDDRERQTTVINS